MRPRRFAVGSALVTLVAGMLLLIAPQAAVALDPVNPVTTPINGHPANSGFGVFVEGNVRLANDESESTIAVGGDLTLVKNYNIAAGGAPVPTFTAPGDARQTFLYVRGGVTWGPGSYAVNVENQGFTKIADTSTYDAFNRDNNNALVNYRIVPKGQTYQSGRFIDGRTNQQTPASIGTPVPTSLIDMDAAFTRYRTLTQQMAACPTNIQLRDTQGTALPRPITPGASGRLTLTPGVTNVLTLTGDELDNLAEITFTNAPTASTPLLVNVVGNFSGTTPNLAGVSGNQAPFMLWNFATASSILVTGGATIEGTIYAPNASVVWAPTQNIEGNVIAAGFSHGPLTRGLSLREIHKFPFNTTLSCASSARLTLVKKVVNDDGGTAAATDWNLSASGPTTISGTTGATAITGATVPTGGYDLAESGGPDGYATGPWHCDGGTLNGARLTLADGDDVTCTITNNDIPVQPPPQAQLSLVKEVVNDDGGTADPTDWTLTADGPDTITGSTGDQAITNADVAPGSYTLSEGDGPDGYDASDWDCSGGALSGDTLTLADGDDVTCTITNDDIPEMPSDAAQLTLVKEVINDDGGTAADTDWTLSATGPATITGAFGDPEITNAVVAPGTYALAESGGPPGYATSDWDCTGGTLAGADLTLAAGDDVICAITNNDIPDLPPNTAQLTLVKEVVNDDGGTAAATDWTLSATGPTTISGNTGDGVVTNADVTPGDYTLAESNGPDGYEPGDWNCTGGTLDGTNLTLVDGDDVICTIVNDDARVSPPTPSPSPTPTPAPGTNGSSGSNGVSGVSSLPDTGGPDASWVLLGLVLSGLGVVAVSSSRRHSRRSSPSR